MPQQNESHDAGQEDQRGQCEVRQGTVADFAGAVIISHQIITVVHRGWGRCGR